MTTIPAPGDRPARPTVITGWQPLTPGTTPHAVQEPLTRTQKILISVVVSAVLVIATLGFIGSYAAVTQLAKEKQFGAFAHAFPIAVDAGIIAFLALDLLLTWRRIGFPLLRYSAWGLTLATIAFNAATAWPDPLGVGMHSVIPVLFVIAVEAARHAIGRIADITADKHIESPPVSRWFLNPLGTFTLWRRQRMWAIRSWETVLKLEQETRIYRATLRKTYGRGWRRKASADQLLVLRLAKDGMSIQEAIDLPHAEARKLAEDEANRQAEAQAKQEAEAEARHQAEIRAAEAERIRRTEATRAAQAEAEAHLELEAKRTAEAEAARILAAETEAKLAEIARREQQAEAEAERNRQARLAEAERLKYETARQAREAAALEAQNRREEQARTRAQRITAQAASASTSDTGTPEAASTSASGSGSARPIGQQRGKRQAEVEAVLARLVEADDPKAVSLAEVMDDFDLTQTTAYDRLKTAQDLYHDWKSKSDSRTA
ncbi:DUF2637 domain-containing protein [Streptomyces sp. NPDC058657]|uniref:DUF2637 domain-containing protein n=1 Tax=unclassified Streptomyces TaxID=2593676 RepID=UPI00364A968C